MAAPVPVEALTAELIQHATKLPSEVRNICNRAAFDTQKRAKMPGRVPRDTGFLAESITVSPATVVAGRTSAAYREGEIVAEVGPEAHYGRHVEEGTVNMAAQPFMAPTVDEVTPGFVKAMGDASIPQVQRG